jgi:diguanylate cyclase (GGDEF)-like protein
VAKESGPVIGLFLDNFFGEYQNRVWEGAAKVAAESGIRLISFADDSLTESGADFGNGRRMHDCADPDMFDGIIVLSPPVVDSEAKKRFADFLGRFSSIPSVHVGVDDEKLARVVPENYAGMRDLVDHLIERHGRSRIAFIRGPEGISDAEQRFAAYRASLEAHGIPYRPALVLEGDFNREAGIQAGARLAESGEIFDAVVGANDYMAFYATKELRRRGYRIPDDVSVGGFDDFRAAKSCVPALCTVHQPMYEMGEAAMRLVTSMIRGKSLTPVRLAFPTKLVTRRSCGCISPGSAGDAALFARELLVGDDIYGAIVAALEAGAGSRFRALLEEAVTEAYDRGTPVSAWRGLVNDMIRGLPLREAQRTERGILDFLSALQDEMNDRAMFALLEEESAFDQLSSRLIGSFEEGAIRDFLDAEVSRRCSYLRASVYSGDGDAKIFYSTDKNLIGRVFEPRLLVPGGRSALPERTDILVLPLSARKKRLGFMVCTAEENRPEFFEVLRRHLAGALEGASLVAAVRDYSAALEREVAQRTAELARAVAELKEMNEKLEQKSSIDEMTGLYNRRGFFELAGKQIELAHRRGAEYLLIFIDIDSLKSINDEYGHAEGDAAIKAMADALASSFRQTDVIARIGGDEFTILAVDTSMRECEKMISRANAFVLEYNKRSGKPYKLSFSYGAAAMTTATAHNFDALMAEADARLYAAKRARKE